MTINAYIEKMTLEEKAAMLQGYSVWTTRNIPRLQIPSMFLSDGPHGLRKQAGAADHLGLNASVPATCFPTAATMANSWNPELGELLGRMLGEEAAVNGVNVVLGPGLNMKRSPLCGRNFEYFSEDPYLAGKMAAAYIRGIQSWGIAACPKHFAVNSQELRRMATNAIVDERTLREIYLTGFEIAVTEGKPKAIMSSYNMINGTYANENPHLLTDILRKEWGFEGFVVTDWGGDNDHVEGVCAGSNLVMPDPGPDCAIGLIKAVREGHVSEKILDLRLKELLPVIFSTCEAISKAPESFDQELHHQISRKCAEESIVLLENDGILPLKAGQRVTIIGDFAEKPRYQGAGSSVVNPIRLDNLKECAEKAGLIITGYAKGYTRDSGNLDDSAISEAAVAAQNGDVVLLCIGLDEISESEGLDRIHMDLPQSQQKLIRSVYRVNPNIILVLSGGSPFIMPEKGLYRAAVHGYLSGQAGAGAMTDVILGKVNPSGKLAESWPLKLEDNPSFSYYPGKEQSSEYREGLYIGYRYYDSADVPVRYPFGYGLSYTTFAYSDICAEQKQVSFTLTNTGAVAGSEIAQVYIACCNGKVFRPKKELKGFKKVFLQAGESRRITIPLDDKAFRYYNAETDGWEVETADYEIFVASSVNDIRLSGKIRVQGSNTPAPCSLLPSYRTGRIKAVSDLEFERLLGHPIPSGHWSREIKRNDTICRLGDSPNALARLIFMIFEYRKIKTEQKGKTDLNLLFIYNMPFRALSKMTGALISDRMVDDIVFIVNGHFLRGTGRLIADFCRNRSQSKKFVKNLELISEKEIS